METCKVKHCPACGEQLSLFDRTHVREKHAKHFHEVRKWQFGFSLSVASVGLFLMLDTLHPETLTRLLSSIGAPIASGSSLFSALKWHSAAKGAENPHACVPRIRGKSAERG